MNKPVKEQLLELERMHLAERGALTEKLEENRRAIDSVRGALQAIAAVEQEQASASAESPED